jgi:hypothetical protein
MVETKGKSLEAIDQAFKQKSSGFSFGKLRRRNAAIAIAEPVSVGEGIHLPARVPALS